MSAAMTFDSLVDDIKTYTERGGDSAFVAQIPRIIALAENRLSSEVKALGYQRYVEGTINSNTAAKPARWRSTIAINITSNGIRYYLKQRSYDYCRAYAPDTTVTGAPVYYADYGYEHFFIAPTPDTDYSFELAYFERPEPLDDMNQTNWTTQYAPQLLLYGCLLECAPFLKNPDALQTWQQMYAQAVAGIAREDSMRVTARTEQRTTV